MGALQRTEGVVTRPAFRTRFWCALAITLFAAVSYGATNEWSHARGVTRCLALPGELHLPLVSWLVVPYMLIDGLLALAPLFTASRQELRTLMLRLFAAFSMGNIIFLLWPCRCGYPRVIPDDWTAPIFQFLHFTDLPYNQAPSLHIVEALLVAPVYLARLPRPALRAAFLLLLVLGSAGTVLTWQHHLVDVLTGAALGLATMGLIRQRH